MTVHDGTVVKDNGVVGEFPIILKTLDPHEAQRTKQRDDHVDLVPTVAPGLQGRPSGHDGHRRNNQYHGVDKTRQDLQFMEWPWIVCPNTQEDVG